MLSRPSAPNPVDYDIDPLIGFVTPQPSELPDYFTPWCNIISDLPRLLESKTLRKRVESLEVLATESLHTLCHWQRAYVILGFLTQAYVWEEKTSPSAIVPASLGDPFIKVCEHLGMEPILSYAGLCIWNWVPEGQIRTSHPSLTLSDFGNIKSCALFTGTRDEDAFYLVPVMVEAQAGPLVQLLLDALNADQQAAPRTLLATLETCTTTLKAMGETLAVLHQNCDPTIFYQQIRPMIAGSVGAEDKGLPNGIVFQRSDGSQLSTKCVGGSAAQSALFQFLDHMFGVHHESKMLVEMRGYMPKNHRCFLEIVEQLPSLRDKIEQYPEDQQLKIAFQDVIDAFRQWRTKHVVIVSRYIVQPAAIETRGKSAPEQKGTAGSLPIPFLKQYRDETNFSTET